MLTVQDGRVKHVVWKLEVDHPLRPDEVEVFKGGQDSWPHGRRDTTGETHAHYIPTMYSLQQAYPNEWD